MRDFAHAQNHPSDRRPHANVNTPRRLPAATAVISSQRSFSRFVLVIDGLLLIVVLWFVFFVVTCNGIYLMSG
ncbi:TPA: hypothetical protein ACJGX5_004878, partial [Salmonella enterica subsp. enterica serovar Senftenberg]